MMFLATANGPITCLQFFMTLNELTAFDKLNEAFYKCAKASHWKESTQRYKANLLLNNLNLQEDLRNGKYKVSPSVNFIITERGKRRYIQSPHMRDRIVQKILCNEILIPQLSKYLIYDNYASLKNRGTTFARKRFDVLLQRYIKKNGMNGYILQIDIKKYFDNIDHSILKQMIHNKIHEPNEVMNLIDYIIDTSSTGNKGLNLGAEAPQIFAVFYLSYIDNFIKTVKGIKYYGRYMDDIFIISDSKDELNVLLKEIKQQLDLICLEINEHKTHVVKLSHGFVFMQIKYNVFDNKIIKRPVHNKIVRERRKLKKYRLLYDKRIMTEFDIYSCYKSWRDGLVKDCNACQITVTLAMLEYRDDEDDGGYSGKYYEPTYKRYSSRGGYSGRSDSGRRSGRGYSRDSEKHDALRRLEDMLDRARTDEEADAIQEAINIMSMNRV